jgi:hypothetical protein
MMRALTIVPEGKELAVPDLIQERSDAHALVDRLPPEQLSPLRNLITNMLDAGTTTKPEDLYERRVAQIPGVTATLTWRDGEVTYLWALIPVFDEALAGQVYSVEAEIQESFDDQFDFYVQVGDYRRLQATLPRHARVRLLNLEAAPS